MPGCARCGAGPTSIAIIGFSAAYAYLEVCEEHLADLLRSARPAHNDDERASSPVHPPDLKRPQSR